MAKVVPNPAVGLLSGKIGDLVFAKQKNGESVVRRSPVRKAGLRIGEVANQEAFADAVRYAKEVWANNPALRAKYNAVARSAGRQGFHLAKADFRVPPKIEDVDLSGVTGQVGDILRIVAVDNFEVVTVGVTICRLDGRQLESGLAVLAGDVWNYRLQKEIPAGQTVRVTVTATDHPGHRVTKVADRACGPQI